MQSLVIVAHGSHLNPESSAPTYDHADTIRATGAFDEVRTGFWKEEPHFREVLRTVEGDEVYVVPLFISEGYFTEQVIPRELRLAGWDVSEWDSDGLSADQATLVAEDIDREVHYCGPVGTHRAMTDVIVRRAESVTNDADVGEGFGLAVVGHEVDDLPEHFESDDVVLVPLFIADGYHTQEDIPEDVGLCEDHTEGYDVPETVDGTRIWYAGAVGTEPLMADVVLERAADAGADLGTALDDVRETTRVATGD